MKRPVTITISHSLGREAARQRLQGGVGKVLEYGGPGVSSLSVPERATITNMGAETGATFSIFPSDEVTRQWLRVQGRESQWVESRADDDAAYDSTIEIDLAGGQRMRISGRYDPDALARLIRGLTA